MSFIPNYSQVAEFGPDDEYEDEEEISYVTLDLGSIEPTLVPSSSTFRLVGLDTPTPFLQLSGTIFKGAHNSLLGSELLFTDAKDQHDWSTRSVNHVAVTEQRIGFKEVQLRPKTDNVEPTPTAAKGKGKADASLSAGSGDTGIVLDRLTGVEPLPTRAQVRAANALAKGIVPKKNARKPAKPKDPSAVKKPTIRKPRQKKDVAAALPEEEPMDVDAVELDQAQFFILQEPGPSGQQSSGLEPAAMEPVNSGLPPPVINPTLVEMDQTIAKDSINEDDPMN